MSLRDRTRPPVQTDLTKCKVCEHGVAGASTSILYCLAGPPRSFAHQMRQPGAPCGPSAFLFAPVEADK